MGMKLGFSYRVNCDCLTESFEGELYKPERLEEAEEWGK
jgi:hypothetical protein